MSDNETWDPDKVRLGIARDLREIVRLWRMLPEEAEHKAIGHDAAEIEAVNLIGPVANLEAWEHQFEAAESLGRDTGYASDQTAELHPLLVLATWEDAVRDERDQPTDLRATVERAADYLGKSVDWMLSTNEYGDMNFIAVDQLATDLRRCRRMLEDVVKEGYRLTRTKVPCMWCEKAPMIAFSTHRGVIVEGRWFCPSCKYEYDPEALILAKSHAMSQGDGWVTITDAAHCTGRSIKTIRFWANPPTPYQPIVASRRAEPSGRLEVKWSDVREQHLARPKRERLPKVSVGC